MPAWASALATLLTIVQWSGILLVFAGTSIFEQLGVPVPNAVASLVDNKFLLIGVFFIAGQLANKVASSGAFEVYLDGELIHSKLQTGGVLRIEAMTEVLRERGLPTWSDIDSLQ